jgi:hypothetical protein
MIHGRIYKIYCNETGECYYGSTEETLSRRLAEHRKGFKEWKDGKRRLTTSFRIIERGNFTISLMEESDFENKYYMKTRERHYIENFECVNKNVPNRTQKEWREANPEHIKEYRQSNREKILGQNKNKYQANKEQIKEKSKESYYANKEKILERMKQKITCECGSVICKGDNSKHLKTKKHLAHIASK